MCLRIKLFLIGEPNKRLTEIYREKADEYLVRAETIKREIIVPSRQANQEVSGKHSLGGGGMSAVRP